MNGKKTLQNQQLGRVTLWMLIKGVVLFGAMYWLLLPWLGEPAFLQELTQSLPLQMSNTETQESVELAPEGESMTPVLQQVQIGDTIYEVEVVTEPADITLGLGGRTEIGSDGMLFDLGSEQTATFWMKDMLIPIDMIWIYQGEIVSYTPDVQPPEPGTSDDLLPIYESGALVDMVLEVPAGFAEQEGFEAGMEVMFVE